MPNITFEILFIVVLLLANGVFAMSELAIIASRKSRLEQRAENDDKSAQAALELANQPGDFLSTVQIGITLIGILAGAIGGGTLTIALQGYLAAIPVIGAYSGPLSVGIVVLLITYLSLIIGELVPKRLALHNPEGVAAAVAPTMKLLARLTAPIVRLLSASTNAVLRLFRLVPSSEPAVTDEEVRLLLEQGAQDGVFEPIEEAIIGQIFRLSDRTVSALFTPRTEIIWLDLDDTPEQIKAKVVAGGHSNYPVARDDLDNVVGLVSAQALLMQSMAGESIDLEKIVRPALFLPETTPALVVVDRLKQTRSHIALVIDEYGGVEGLVTLEDILTALVGDFPNANEAPDAEAVQREDGSWLVDGMFQIDDFKDRFELETMPDVGEGYYQTVSGLVMAMLGRIPDPGDYFDWAGYRVEVMDMDGRRVDKVLVTRIDEGNHPAHHQAK